MGAKGVATPEPMAKKALGTHLDLLALTDALAVASEARRQAVVALHESGWTYARIGELLGLTRGRVSNICNDR
jgi:DNA-directed RNA polymerase specialized sigma24 family protein